MSVDYMLFRIRTPLGDRPELDADEYLDFDLSHELREALEQAADVRGFELDVDLHKNVIHLSRASDDDVVAVATLLADQAPLAWFFDGFLRDPLDRNSWESRPTPPSWDEYDDSDGEGHES